MTVIIRPTPEIFRRTHPLMVVFGAFCDLPSAAVLPDRAQLGLQAIVCKARRYRIPLAFCRRLGADGDAPDGFWLADCRPRISDRVFEHTGPSALSNREFRNMVTRMEDRPFFAAGTPGDSAYLASVTDMIYHNANVRTISCTEALHFRSGAAPNAAAATVGTAINENSEPLAFGDWVGKLRTVEVSD